VVEPAIRPVDPLKLPSLLVAAAAFFVGAFGAFALLYLARIANTSIETVDQAEHLLGVPVWAAIPVAKSSRKKLLPHVIAADPASNCAESFRTLRTTATIAKQESEKKILLFTSADPSEGKSFCSVNHAICQAQEGKVTLLIDLDLRRPSVGASFSLPMQTPGVTDYLLDKNSVMELARPTLYENLFVLPAGPMIPNPSEKLSSGAIRNLLEEASANFDRVIIDTAPINAVSDSFLVLPLADVICLVVRSRRTPQRAVQRAIELMVRANVPPSGIVLNFLPARGGNGYYHYAPQYGYNNGVYGTNGSMKELARS
jgi:polysaccharide biosynthesis transport protein